MAGRGGEAGVAKKDSGGFLAGLLVGGLVGAALALLYTPRSGQQNRGALLERAGNLVGVSPDVVLERGREALRARFRSAAAEAQHAAAETEQRLQDEYRSATHST